MKLTKIECPSCGAGIKFALEENTVCECDYCGSKYLIEGINSNKLKLTVQEDEIDEPKDNDVEPKKKETYTVHYSSSFNFPWSGFIQVIAGMMLAMAKPVLELTMPDRFGEAAKTASETAPQMQSTLMSMSSALLVMITIMGIMIVLTGMIKIGKGLVSGGRW